MGTRRRAAVRAISAGLVFTLVGPGPARAADSPADFTGMSMEQLMEVELVYAAARRAQSLRDAPSAVTVVTADEIRRQGYRTLADLLRALPSFFVTYDRNYTYVGTRGFGRPGDFNSRVLLLLNGVRVNDNGYDSMYVGNEALVDLDLVERVEVVRGPAASLYGNSAFFAVINVVTRSGAQMGGGEVTAAAGGAGTVDGRASYGGRTSSGVDFLVSASALHSEGADLSFPEFAQEQEGRAVGLDGEEARRLFASATWRGLSLQVARSWRDKEIPTASYGTVFGSPDTRTHDVTSQVALQFERKVAETQLAARAYHGRYSYSGRYAQYETASYTDGFEGAWWVLEASAVRPLGARHLLTVGAEGQWNARQDQRGGYEGSADDIAVRASGTRWSAFAQDEIKLLEGLRLHVGVRHDGAAAFGGHTSPRVALVHTSGVGAVKLLYGSAFRAPNEYELHYYPEHPALRPETIRTAELVWERPLGSAARTTVSVFDNRIANLLTITGEDDDLHFYNAGRIHSRGFETGLEWRRPRGLRSRLSYSLQKTVSTDGDILSNSPRHMAKVDVDAPLLGGRVWAGVNAQYTSRRGTLSGASVAGYTRANLTLTAPRLFRHLDLTASVHNVFDVRYADPGSEEHRQDALEQDGRSLRVKAVWTF
jgi:outer membrane cobalamin receptor